MPVHVAELERKANRIERELTGKLGRVPTEEEVAEGAKVSIAKLREARDAVRMLTSLDRPIGEDGTATLGDQVAGPEGDPLAELAVSLEDSALERALEASPSSSAACSSSASVSAAASRSAPGGRGRARGHARAGAPDRAGALEQLSRNRELADVREASRLGQPAFASTTSSNTARKSSIARRRFSVPGAVDLLEHRVPVPEALDDVRVVGRDVGGLILPLDVDGIPALVEDAHDDVPLAGASGVTRVAHEARLGLTPLVRIALARGGRERADVELVVLLLHRAQPALGVAPPELETARSYSGPKRSTSLAAAAPDRRERDEQEQRGAHRAARTIHSQVSTVPSRSQVGSRERHGDAFRPSLGGASSEPTKGEPVNEDRIEGKAKEVEGETQQSWGEAQGQGRGCLVRREGQGEDLVDEARDRLDRDDEASAEHSERASTLADRQGIGRRSPALATAGAQHPEQGVLVGARGPDLRLLGRKSSIVRPRGSARRLPG